MDDTVGTSVADQYLVIVTDPEYLKGRLLFSKMGTKSFKVFICRANADIKQSDVILRK